MSGWRKIGTRYHGPLEAQDKEDKRLRSVESPYVPHDQERQNDLEGQDLS